MQYELKSYSFGQMFGNTISLYLDNVVMLLSLSLITSLTVFIPRDIFSGDSEYNIMLIIILGIINMIIRVFVSAVYINIIARKYLNEPMSIVSAIKNIGPIILPLIWLNILIMILVMLGAFLFIIPGIIIALMYSLSITVMVIEGRSIRLCLKRSKDLISGYKWQALCIFGIIGIFSTIIIGVSGQMLGGNKAIEYISNAVFTPLMVCAVISIYFKMRIDKEGFALEHLANQFSFETVNSTGESSKENQNPLSDNSEGN